VINWLCANLLFFDPVKILHLSRVNSIKGMTEAHPVWLIAACIAGKEDAIEMLVRQYETGVFRLAMSIVGDEGEANEITQETFLSALRSLPSYQEKTSFKAWLYTIAVNHSRSHLRKRKVVERLRVTLTNIFRMETEKQVSPEEAIMQNEKQAALWRSLSQLDERHRIVVELRYFHELSVAEISDVLSVPEGTVHSRLHHAREKLRDALKHIQKE
jgi:RNA polymerase sigma-70 factor, ECF subfamily